MSGDARPTADEPAVTVLEYTRAAARVAGQVEGLENNTEKVETMKAAGHRRDREIDGLAENMRESTRVVGQAPERQGAAITQAFTQQGHALERQGEVLAELLRRSA